MIFDPAYMLFVMVPTMIFSLAAQWKVNSTLKKWSSVPNERGLSGHDTARIIMGQANLNHVRVGQIRGELTDHYDPRDKAIRLSATSTTRSVAALAIVAHELGHAEQDATGNAALVFRTHLAPAAGIGSQLGLILAMLGLYIQATGLAWLGIGLFSIAVLFSIVTLPVEFDASRRALGFLERFNLVSAREMEGAKAVLSAAALTYVAATATAILNLLYWVSLISGRSRD